MTVGADSKAADTAWLRVAGLAPDRLRPPVSVHSEGASPTTFRPIEITAIGHVTLRPPVPSQSKGDGFASDLTHAQPLGGGDPERVIVRTHRGHPS